MTDDIKKYSPAFLRALQGELESSRLLTTDAERDAKLEAVAPGVRAVLDKARTLVRHWIDQDGFNSQVIDELRDAVVAFDLGIEGDLEGDVPPQLGPYCYRCNFCGKVGDESTLDPVSGDGWGCPGCVDGYQRGGAT